MSRKGTSALIAAAGLSMMAMSGLLPEAVRTLPSPPRRRPPTPRNTPEIEAWNAAVERRKAEKKAPPRNPLPKADQ